MNVPELSSRPLMKNGKLLPLASSAVTRMADLGVLFKGHYHYLCADHAAPLSGKYQFFEIEKSKRPCEVCNALKGGAR